MRNYVFSFFILLFSSVLAESEEDGFVQHGSHEHGAALLNVALDGPDLVLEFISPAINIVGFEHAPSTNEQMELVEAAVTQLSDGEALFEVSARAKCQLTNTEVESELAEEGEHSEEDEHSTEHEAEEGEYSEEDEHSIEHEEVEEVEVLEESENLEEAPKNKNFFMRFWESIWFRNRNNQEASIEKEHSTENEHLEVDEDSEEADHLAESEIVEEDEHANETEEEDEHHDEYADGDEEEGEVHSEFHAMYEFTCNSPERLENIDLNNLFAAYPGIEDLDVQFVLPDSQGARELNKDNTSLQF